MSSLIIPVYIFIRLTTQTLDLQKLQKLKKINFVYVYSCIHIYYYHIYCPGLLRYYKTTSKKQYASSYEMKSEHFISAESLESAVAKRKKVLTQGM